MNIIEKKIFLSSVEIAELTGKRHDNVMRDIEVMLTDISPSNLSSSFENTYMSKNNQSQRCYVLPKREVLILVSGYNVKLRASIIDRLEYLENPKIPTLRESLETSLMLLEKNEKQALEIERLEVIEGVHKVITDSTGLHTVSEGAKILGTGQNRLFEILRNSNVLMPDNIPYQRYIDSGHFEIKVKSYKNKGESKSYTKTFITNKGLDYIKKLLGA